MSTHKNLDRICVAIVAGSLVLTTLFINGESFGITKIVDEDAEQNSDSAYFTTKDQDGDWDTSSATVITLTGDGADISGNGAYTNDGNVVITNAGYYVVTGSLTDGYISVDAYDSSKVFIQLAGVEINCSDDACIRVDQADKVFLTLAQGSQNILTSGSTYTDEALEDGTDGAIFAHDDLTINGSGSLTVTAEYRHGIAANDDLVITGGNITVTAPADGVRGNDSLRIKDASITVDAGDDGLVTSNEEENGYLYIESGTLNITAADDAIHTTGEITMAGGDVTITAGDDGIHSDTAFYISDGTLLINDCYEGVEALIIEVSGGDITIYPEDDGFNANGNSSGQMGGMGGGQMGGGLGQNSTDGDTGAESTSGGDMGGQMQGPPDMGSANGGMPAGPGMGATDGEMPASPDMGATDGEMPAAPDMGSTDGAAAPDMNSADGSTQSASETTTEEETYLSISGGTITIINENGNDADGLDSNGDIRISGGTIYVSLKGDGSNSAVDYGSESGGVAEITGGTIIACGASSMAEAFDSTSTQASILYNTSTTAEAGTTLAIEDADGNVLLSWDVPCSFSSALISCPEMEVGGTYTVVIGDNVEEITLEEVSASYGDAQSSMFGGNMNWGGMESRGQGGPGGGQTPPDMSGSGNTGMAAGQTPPDMAQSGDTGMAAGETPADMGQEGMNGPMMQEEEQSQEEEDEAAQDTATSAEPVDAKTWGILGGCAALLAAAIGIGKFYKRP